MKILSLFDGISCARVVIERLKIPIKKYYASETNKYAIQIAQKNYPDTIQIGDVCNISLKKFPEIYKPDLMILGSPCQDLSISKKNREGLKGKRSGLFWEAIRIHKEIEPKWFVYENVSSMKREWKQQMLKAIQEIEPKAYMIEINATLVSAQNRKRVFFTNIPNIEQPKDKGILLKDILEDNVNESFVYNRKDGVGKKLDKSVCLSASDWRGLNRNQNQTCVRIGKIGKGGQGDRIYSPNGKSISLSANGGGRGAKTGLYKIKDSIRKLTPIECERLQSLPDNYTEGVSNTQRYRALGDAFNCQVIKHILKIFLKINN